MNTIKYFAKKFSLIFFLTFLIYHTSQAQQVGINILIPDSSAILHLEADDKGFLPPRLTTAQRDDINNPATGLVIFNTSDSTLQIYNGECWLHSYQQNCDDCFFNLALSDLTGHIDHVNTDSAQTTLNLTQTGGSPQIAAVSIGGNLPPGLTYIVNPNPVPSDSSTTITFTATPFTPGGTYPIIIEVLCGPTIKTIIYTLTIDDCYEVIAFNSANNYNLATNLYIQHPNAPTNVAI